MKDKTENVRLIAHLIVHIALIAFLVYRQITVGGTNSDFFRVPIIFLFVAIAATEAYNLGNISNTTK